MRVKLTLALLFTMTSAFAVDYQITITDNTYDAGTMSGALSEVSPQIW